MPLVRIHDKSLLPLLPYLRPRQNGRHFADGMLEYIFLIEIDIAFDWNFTNIASYEWPFPALVQVMVLCRLGDKPSTEPMMAWDPFH